MGITFRRAVRENVGLVVGIAGPSGGGKSLSAMRLADGMSNGKPFAVIDTEAGRAKHYANSFAFDHADLEAPFRPEAYAEAIIAADKAGYPVIIVDSCSHEYAGDGGLLDWQEEELERMAGQDYQKRESCKMASWVKPKMAHKRMVQRLLQVRAHLILCFRAEQKTEMVKENGRTVIRPKTHLSGFSDWIPICEKNMLYELTASFLLTPDAPGVPKPIKLQRQMRELIDLSQPLSEDAGQKMAAWAAGTGAASSVPTGSAKPSGVAESDPATSGGHQDVFEESKAKAECQAALDNATTTDQLQRVWDGITRDKAIGPQAKGDLFKVYKSRLAALAVKR